MTWRQYSNSLLGGLLVIIWGAIALVLTIFLGVFDWFAGTATCPYSFKVATVFWWIVTLFVLGGYLRDEDFKKEPDEVTRIDLFTIGGLAFVAGLFVLIGFRSRSFVVDIGFAIIAMMISFFAILGMTLIAPEPKEDPSL